MAYGSVQKERNVRVLDESLVDLPVTTDDGRCAIGRERYESFQSMDAVDVLWYTA